MANGVLTAINTWLAGLVGREIPELYIILGGVALTLLSIWWAEGLSRFAVNVVIKLFRLGGKKGPQGKELAARMLAAAGAQGITLDETVLDTNFRLNFGDIDYQPDRGVLELTSDKANRADLSNAGLVILEVGRALQYRSGSPLVFIRRVMSKPVAFAGFAWIWPGVGANVLPLMLPPKTGVMVSDVLYTITAALLGLVLLYTILRVPMELDAARRGVIAMEDAGIFSFSESVAIQVFLALVLTVTFATTFIICLNIFRSMSRK